MMLYDIDSLYHNLDIGAMWHWALVSWTPSQSIGLFFWDARCSGVSLCVPFTNSLTEFYFIMIVAAIIGIFMTIILFWNTCLGFLKLSISALANAHLPGCFRPWTFPLNIGLNMLPSDSLLSCLDHLLGYSTEEFQVLQVIVLAVFGTVD